MASSTLPPDAVEQVRLMKSLERDILADADRAASGVDGSEVGVSGAHSKDPTACGRAGLAHLNRELRELESLAEEQVRPDDKSGCLDALAERVAARDAIAQMLRELALKAAQQSRRSDRSARAELLGEDSKRGSGDENGDGDEINKTKPPSSETAALAMAQSSTESLRRSRAMMSEELKKGKWTLAQMEESRDSMRKTQDEYTGEQRAQLSGGGKMLNQLERQAVWERYTLWVGFSCFMLAAAHVVLKRTPLLVRFHPLWWIRHAHVRKEKEAAKAAAMVKAAKIASATPTLNTHRAPTPLATAVAANLVGDKVVMDAIHAATYLYEMKEGMPEEVQEEIPGLEVETGDYAQEHLHDTQEL